MKNILLFKQFSLTGRDFRVKSSYGFSSGIPNFSTTTSWWAGIHVGKLHYLKSKAFFRVCLGFKAFFLKPNIDPYPESSSNSKPYRNQLLFTMGKLNQPYRPNINGAEEPVEEHYMGDLSRFIPLKNSLLSKPFFYFYYT